jgi:pimeloyl-ACP methyl ester carboxylesterase
MRKLFWLGVVVLLLAVNTVWTNRETKDAEADGAQVIKLDGGDLRYRDQGDRDDPVVVLLHGYACSLDWWDRVAPDLVRRGRRVIRFDLLGHGGSEMPRDGYAIENQANLVGDALGKLRVRRATIVGHSMGGTVASSLVQERPKLVRRIAVIGTSPREGFAELPLTARIGTWPVMGQLARRFVPDPLIKANLDSAFADGTEVPDEFVDDVDGMTYSAFKGAREEADEFVEAKAPAKRIGDTRVPLLVIFGKEDDIVDPDAAFAWKQTVPRARLVRLDDVGHSPHWEAPRDVVQELLDFTSG